MQMIAIAWLITTLACCTTGNNTTTAHITTDTLLLFKNDSTIVTGIAAANAILHLPAGKNLEPVKKNKFLLVLNNPKVAAAPEGVYEIYLTNSPVEIDQLTSSGQSFVSLLDLYSFTAPGAKQQVEIDITRQVKDFYSAKESTTPLFVIFKFAPVKLADGTFSVQAGTVQFTGLRVIRVND